MDDMLVNNSVLCSISRGKNYCNCVNTIWHDGIKELLMQENVLTKQNMHNRKKKKKKKKKILIYLLQPMIIMAFPPSASRGRGMASICNCYLMPN